MGFNFTKPMGELMFKTLGEQLDCAERNGIREVGHHKGALAAAFADEWLAKQKLEGTTDRTRTALQDVLDGPENK